MTDFASVVLRRTADTDDEITLSRLTVWDRDHTHDGTFVQFEGRSWPTGHRSTARTQTRRATVLFARDEQAAAADLVEFFERAVDAADADIDVIPDVALSARLNEQFTVQVHHWTLSHLSAGRVEVAFELHRVG